MQDRVSQNKRFLRNICEKGAFERHGFICNSVRESTLIDGLDYSVSPRPLEEFVPLHVRPYESDLRLLDAVGGDAVPFVSLMTGTGLYAEAFGCRIEVSEGTNPFAVPRVCSSVEADALEQPRLEDSRAATRVFEFGEMLRRELGPDVDMGPPDMQTGFDTASLVWEKGDLMTAMLTEPEAVHRLSAKAAAYLKGFLSELRRAFPNMSPCHCPHAWVPPEMGPWVSNDECGTMSTEMFESFCLPELIDLADTFGSLGMHCCAQAEHQFPSFRKIPNFYAFNRVAATQGFDPILEHFGGEAGPVHVLCWLSEETIKHLIREAPEGTRFVFVLSDADRDAAERWLDSMRSKA